LSSKRAAAARPLLTDPARGAPDDEAYWTEVRSAFEPAPGQVNLVTAVRGVTTRAVRERIAAEAERLNAFRPSESGPDWRERVRAKAAAFIGAAPGEVALVRNTTEGVTTVLREWPLAQGDEILTTSTEHGPFYDTLAARAARDGVVVRRVHLPVPATRVEAIVDAVNFGLGPRTRLVMIPHVVLTGQIMPVRAIADRVHARGAHLLVDGVLGIGHVATDVRAMNCDFYAAGFHKWGCGPRATAVFWVRKDLVARLPSLFGSVSEDSVPRWNSSSMTKYESFGAHPDEQFFALGDSLDFLSAIGLRRIQARLFWLTHRWTIRALELDGFRLAVQLDPAQCAGLAAWEWYRYPTQPESPPLVSKGGKILLGVTEPYAGVFGIPKDEPRRLRITNAGIFTTPAEVDHLAEALETLART
jgi:selenocysteine lyase/cysteine desulfurase